MTPEVATAIEELGLVFDGHEIKALEEPQGGAYVIVEDLDLGDHYTPRQSWIGFQIGFQYPQADVYPHFLRPDLVRADGAPFTPPLNPGQIMPGFEIPAIMLSRRSPRRDPALDTASHKLLRIIEWLRSR